MAEHRELRHGSKTLSVDITPERGTATIRFGTRFPRWLFRRRTGETTEIFHRADRSIHEAAQRSGRDITLTFDTANSNLKRWAVANAGHLRFDSVDPGTDGAYRQTVRKTYRP